MNKKLKKAFEDLNNFHSILMNLKIDKSGLERSSNHEDIKKLDKINKNIEIYKIRINETETLIKKLQDENKN